MLIDLLSGNLEDHFGSVKAFLGTMATGKSTFALAYISIFREFANELNCEIDIFRPTIDNRTQMSRIGLDRGNSFIGIDQIRVASSQEIRDYAAAKKRFGKRRVMLFDEPQFIDSGFIPIVEELKALGHLVILSMLDTDFRGESFSFNDYASTADDLLKNIPDRNKYYLRLARCRVCKQTADYSHRLINGQPAPYYDPLRLVDSEAERERTGKNYTYEPRCKDHFTVPWKEEAYALETLIKRNPGLTKNQAHEIANDALKIPADIADQTLNMFITEKRVIEQESKLYKPLKIITATEIPR